MKFIKLLPVLLIAVLTVSLLAASGTVKADASYDGDAVVITLLDGASSCADSSVLINGDTVTITAEGDYVLTGSLSDGQIVIDAPEDAKVKLILDNVTVVNTDHAAVYAVSADKLVLSSAENSVNFFQTSGAFVQTDDNNVDAAVYAACDLTLSGEGVLNVSCLSGHAIVSKDDVKLKSGTVNLEASNKGLVGKDSVTIEGGVLNADVGTDAVCSDSESEGKGGITVEDGSLNLLSQKEGLDASGDIEVLGGTLVINAGSGQKGKGLKADGDITVSGGSLSVTSVDDALHAGGSVTLSGGDLTLSTGDDGVHADSTLTVTGGSVYVSQSYEGLEAQVISIEGGEVRINARDDGLNAAGGSDGSNGYGFFGGDPFDTDADASLTISGGTVIVNADGDGLDSNGYLTVSGGLVLVSGPTNSANGAIDSGIGDTITGGTVIAAGASGMAENFGQSSTQGSILLSFASQQAAGSAVTVTDANGNVLASFTPEKSYNSVVVSTPELVQGGTYTVTAGSESQTVTLDSLIYGSGMGMGGFGGGMMGGFGRSQGQWGSQNQWSGSDGGMTPPDTEQFDGQTPPDMGGAMMGPGQFGGQPGGFGGHGRRP